MGGLSNYLQQQHEDFAQRNIQKIKDNAISFSRSLAAISKGRTAQIFARIMYRVLGFL